MHKLYELKEKMCDELEKYSGQELTGSALEIVDKLAHAIKNIDKIIEKYDGQSYGDGRNYMMGRYPDMNSGMSFAGRGAGAKRDSMGRYSRGGNEMAMELREIMAEAPASMKGDFQKLIEKVEYM